MVEPLVPFAPPVRLAALLDRAELGLRLVAGDPAAELHWVHTSEMADPYPYLLGGELLLTAGVQLDDPERFVARAARAGAAALGFGVTPVYDTVPGALVEACGRHGLPLVEVEPGTTFAAVARAVWRLMADARHHELRRVADAQRALAAAAARPAPVPAVLRALAAHLGGRAALYAPDGGEYAAAGRALGPREASALARLVGVVTGGAGPGGAAGSADPGGAAGPADSGRPGGSADSGRPAGGTGGTGGAGPSPGAAAEVRRPASAAEGPDGPGGARLVAYALGSGREGLTLGLAMARHEEADRRIAETAMVLLSLLTAPHQGADEATRSAALVRLLLGADPADVAPLLGAAPWTVVHARSTDPQAPPPALGSPLVDGGPEGADPASPARARTVRVLLPAGREAAAYPGWTLGVSAPAAPAALAAADAQAARALRRAEPTHRPLARHRAGGFAALVDDEEAAAHARTLLGPLLDAPVLVETLRVWLSLHGGWDRTAAALGVHRNTVRQRVARCAALLDTDLEDPDVRMELWFALRAAGPPEAGRPPTD
ncbi:PucR family transcriptional regulator [Streptomyces sp. DH12]|uniref:helix-turn-helix domain-containing protein n=1 Tax=Streptomyces sp. DH12 TaxID=2857010 RepID=UPI001E5B80FE|nr:PucR family transcriptional regulator [Streptomyces sp. DH12]